MKILDCSAPRSLLYPVLSLHSANGNLLPPLGIWISCNESAKCILSSRSFKYLFRSEAPNFLMAVEKKKNKPEGNHYQRDFFFSRINGSLRCPRKALPNIPLKTNALENANEYLKKKSFIRVVRWLNLQRSTCLIYCYWAELFQYLLFFLFLSLSLKSSTVLNQTLHT